MQNDHTTRRFVFGAVMSVKTYSTSYLQTFKYLVQKLVITSRKCWETEHGCLQNVNMIHYLNILT